MEVLGLHGSDPSSAQGRRLHCSQQVVCLLPRLVPQAQGFSALWDNVPCPKSPPHVEMLTVMKPQPTGLYGVFGQCNICLLLHTETTVVTFFPKSRLYIHQPLFHKLLFKWLGF